MSLIEPFCGEGTREVNLVQIPRLGLPFDSLQQQPACAEELDFGRNVTELKFTVTRNQRHSANATIGKCHERGVLFGRDPRSQAIRSLVAQPCIQELFLVVVIGRAQLHDRTPHNIACLIPSRLGMMIGGMVVGRDGNVASLSGDPAEGSGGDCGKGDRRVTAYSMNTVERSAC